VSQHRPIAPSPRGVVYASSMSNDLGAPGDAPSTLTRRRESPEFLFRRFSDQLGPLVGRAIALLGSGSESATPIETALGELFTPRDHELAGMRAESLFREVAIALGQVEYLKQEDQGDWFTHGINAAPVDFLLGLNNGHRLAVEVKNCHKTLGAIGFKKSYISALERYSRIVAHDLKVAIYWSKWRMWTLVDPRFFEDVGPDRVRLSFESANMWNEMSRLGDRILMTRPPIGLRVRVKTQGVQEFSTRKTEREFLVERLTVLAGGREVESTEIASMVLQFLMHGTWASSGWDYRSEGGQEFVELLSSPPEYQPASADSGLEIVGALSTLCSNAILEKLGESGADLPHGTCGYEYGEMVRLVPADFNFDNPDLRLAVLRVQPPDPPAPGEEHPDATGK